MTKTLKPLTFFAIILVTTSLACTVALFESPANSDISSDAISEVAPETGDAPASAPESAGLASDAEENRLINLYKRVNPAVVNINVSAETEGGELADFGSGSGFIIDTEGHIVTNFHVVADATAIRVILSDGTVLEAEVLGGDPYADLAVLKVDPPAGYTLTVVALGDSEEIQVGQSVVAIGNPFGLSGSMTTGIVSGVGRTLATGVVTQTGGFSNPLIIQTDAAINPGNSGGPLLNSNGEVIGVNYAIRSTSGTSSGVGFAIPVNTVKRVAPQLIANGAVEYPYLGISSQTAFSLGELAQEFDLPVTQGVMIADVAPNSGSSRAGLRGGDRSETFRGAEIQLGGDIIIAINGVPIGSFDELLGYLVSNTSVGDTIIVTIVRDGEEMQVEVTLSPRP